MQTKQLQNILIILFAIISIWLLISLFARLAPMIIWGLSASLVIVLLIYLGLGMEGHPVWFGVLVDKNRNRTSLSRLQVTLWTVVIISAYLTVSLIRTMPDALDLPLLECIEIEEQNCTPQPLNISFPNEIWLALGISTVSFAGSSLIKHNKRNKFKLEHQTNNETAIVIYRAEEPKLRDIFYGDDEGNKDSIDLSKVQMFFFTVVLITVYVFAIGSFITNENLIRSPNIFEFPSFSTSMTVILGISHAGYLFVKAPYQK